jgi:hypothetical protein
MATTNASRRSRGPPGESGDGAADDKFPPWAPQAQILPMPANGGEQGDRRYYIAS